MSQEQFFERIRASSPDAIAREFLFSDSIHLFSEREKYAIFQGRVRAAVPFIDAVAIVGSGNWRYSLNPDKNFREFGDHSDIDLAVISSHQFHRLWEEMRQHHRRHFYRLSPTERLRLRRDSENVYAGFISPAWIPSRDRKRRYEYQQLLNQLSDSTVKFLRVKMLFFKNANEAVDYYARGFRAAKGVLS